MIDTEMLKLESDVEFQLQIHTLRSRQYEKYVRETPNINDQVSVYLREELRKSWFEYQVAMKKLSDYSIQIYKGGKYESN